MSLQRGSRVGVKKDPREGGVRHERTWGKGGRVSGGCGESIKPSPHPFPHHFIPALSLFFLHVDYNNSAIMGEVQAAICLLINAFQKYAGRDGDKNSMNKGEVKEMLNQEFGLELGKAKDQTAIDRIFKDLDANSDNSVDFMEFVSLVASLALVLQESMMHGSACKK
ncbi:ictacalcin-like [Festucalex cinctus]